MELLEMFKQFVVIIVVLICLCVGYVLKNIVKTDKINDYIPLIMAVLGVVLNLWLNAWTFTPQILLGGLVSGLASTGLYEAFKNMIEKYKKNITIDSANDTEQKNE